MSNLSSAFQLGLYRTLSTNTKEDLMIAGVCFLALNQVLPMQYSLLGALGIFTAKKVASETIKNAEEAVSDFQSVI